MKFLCDLAVIIPIAPGDITWANLVADLKHLPQESEILFVGSEAPSEFLRHLLIDLTACRNVKWLQAPKGRGQQLNAGARATQKPYLWFLHADSRFTQSTLPALDRSLQRQPHALHYFDLAFLDDGPTLTVINAVGVWVRSHLIGLPFGDQGFCLARQIFEKLGSFKDAAYGEDHLLVWQARTQRVSLCCTGALLRTSARKYRENGWLATTLKHLILTAKQAVPELLTLVRTRLELWRFSHPEYGVIESLQQASKQDLK